MPAANLALRFLLEIAALAALAWAGWQAAEELWLRVVLAVAAPLAFAAVWGTWISPRAPRRLRDPAKAVVEGALFGAAAAALFVSGFPGLAVLFGVFAAGSIALTFYFRQRDL